MSGYESTTQRMPGEQPGLCALVQDMLPFYIEGEVSEESRAFIDGHLAQCERCGSFMAGARSVQAHLARETGVRARAYANDLPARQMIARGRQRLLGMLLLAAGALALVAVLGITDGRFFNGRRAATEPARTVVPAAAGPGSFALTSVPPSAVEAPALLIPTSIPPPTPFAPTVVPPTTPTPAASVP